MRVIDKNLKLPFGGNHFEASRNLRWTREREDRLAQVNPHGVRGRQRRHRIGDVEPPNEWNAYQIAPAFGVELIRSASKFRSVIRCPKIGARSHSIGHDRDSLAKAIDQLLTVAIIDIDDCDRMLLFLLRSDSGKQFCLRLEIIFHGAVKIEMVLRQIGENDDVPFDSAGPFLGKRVRRNLHGGGATAGIYDLREQLLHIERFRGRPGGGNHPLANLVLNRADQSRAQAGFLANVFDQKCRRCFAVGSSHACHF